MQITKAELKAMIEYCLDQIQSSGGEIEVLDDLAAEDQMECMTVLLKQVMALKDGTYQLSESE